MKNVLEVMVIDDHPLVLDGVASWLEETGRFSVCARVSSLDAARQIFKKAETLPDFIILDIMIGGEDGLDFLPFLEEFCKGRDAPKPPVLICSVIEDPFRIRSAVKMGAGGFVSKADGKEELLNAIDTVLKGGVYLSKERSKVLEESYSVHSKFTKRELQVINLIKLNKTNQQIAKTLGINIRTVENHISNIYFKTGMSVRQELVGM